MIGIEIVSDRTIIRNFKPRDSIAMFKNWGTDEKVAENMLWKVNKTQDDVDKTVAFWIKKSETDENFIQLAIELKETNEAIGSIQLDWNPKHHSAELGFCLSSNWWGKGVMKEVLTNIEKFAKEKLNIHRIEAQVLVRNERCAEMLQKLNYNKEGICVDKYFTKRNQFENCYIFAKILN